MLEGYIEFFMDPSLAECYLKLKEEMENLLRKKVNFLLVLTFSLSSTLLEYETCT